MIGAALRAYLLSLDDLVEICGARIYPTFATQGAAYPFVIYGKTSNSRNEGEQCLEDNCPGSGAARFDIHCRALDPDVCDAMGLAIFGSKGKARLDGYEGVMTGGERSYRVSCRIEDMHDEAFPPVHGEETWLADVTLTVRIQYEEI